MSWASIKDEPADKPAAPKPPQAPPATQLGLALVDTPEGQRLALTMTVLLPAGDAKSFAQALTQAASNLSTSGLLVANGTVKP